MQIINDNKRRFKRALINPQCLSQFILSGDRTYRIRLANGDKLPEDTRIKTVRFDYETPDLIIFLESAEFESVEAGKQVPLLQDNGFIKIFADDKNELIDSRILKKHLDLLRGKRGANVIKQINEALEKGVYDENCERYALGSGGSVVDIQRDQNIASK